MKTISVYSTPNCVQCRATYRKLDQLRVDYKKVTLGDDPADREAVDAILESDPTLDRIAPMVIVGNGDGEPDMIWTGYQPASIEKYCAPEAAS